MTAVAVWGKHRSANELLEYRLSKDWKPTPSRLKEGYRIEDHAARILG